MTSLMHAEVDETGWPGRWRRDEASNATDAASRPARLLRGLVLDEAGNEHHSNMGGVRALSTTTAWREGIAAYKGPLDDSTTA
jgi:hypothetical protein